MRGGVNAKTVRERLTQQKRENKTCNDEKKSKVQGKLLLKEQPQTQQIE